MYWPFLSLLWLALQAASPTVRVEETPAVWRVHLDWAAPIGVSSKPGRDGRSTRCFSASIGTNEAPSGGRPPAPWWTRGYASTGWIASA